MAGAGSWLEGWWVSPRSLEPGYDPLEAAEDIPAGEQQTARSKTNQKVSLNTSQKLPGVSPQSVSPTNPQNWHGPVLSIKIYLDCSLGWKDEPIPMVWSSLAWLNCSGAEFKKAIIDNLRGYLQKRIKVSAVNSSRQKICNFKGRKRIKNFSVCVFSLCPWLQSIRLMLHCLSDTTKETNEVAQSGIYAV